MMKNFPTKYRLGVLVALFIFFIVLMNLVQVDGVRNEKEIIFSEFLAKAKSNQVKQVKIRGNEITGTLVQNNKGEKFKTYGALYTNIIAELKDTDVEVEILPMSSRVNTFVNILISFAPIIVLSLFWFFIARQMQNAGSKAFGFTKSKAKLASSSGPKVTFKDVAGIDDAKDELTELVDFLKDPIKFHRLGGKIPKGCLLLGPPGVGKTLLAKAIAGEANVPFFSISGSDFVEMFVGIGASRVRDMFAQGKKHAPCIIFIDEIDAVGRSRGGGMGTGHEEREQTLNQLLVEMDGFKSNEGIIIIAATNRPDVLDHAILRPGRFDRQISISAPDIKGRENILKVHLKKIKYSQDMDVRVIARGTPGFSGAQLANLVNESALIAAKRGKDMVYIDDMEMAKDKVIMGVEKKSVIISDKQKEITAYHEAGHAIVSLYVKESDPIHKVTIIPRGMALGMVVRLPEDDRTLESKQKIESNIRVAIGGRVAEELIFGKEHITPGASSDIKAATKYAKAMVMQWGMSDKVGFVFHHHSDSYLNYLNQSEGLHSEHTAKTIDEEVKRIIDLAYADVRKILQVHLEKLHSIAKVLMEKETLTGAEVKQLIEVPSKPQKVTKSRKSTSKTPDKK